MTEEIMPVINSVTGLADGTEIPEGTSTDQTAVKLKGIASRGQTVEIYEGSTSQGTSLANIANGEWESDIFDLAIRKYSFTIKALYGSRQISRPPRTFSLIEPDIIIDDFGPDTELVNGQTRDLGKTSMTYYVNSGNPLGRSGGTVVFLSNDAHISRQGEHRVLFDLKVRNFKKIRLTLRTYLVQAPSGTIVGRLNFMDEAGISHTQPIYQNGQNYDINLTIPNERSYNKFEVIQFSAPRPNGLMIFFVVKAVCSNS